MNTTLKQLGSLVLVLIVLGGAWWLISSHSGYQDKGPITIGFVGALTGEAASYGEPMKNGVQLAVDEINKAGGVHGRQITVIYEDGKCSGQDAASAAQKLVNVDGVKYIIGGVCSGESFSIAPIVTAAKAVEISPGSSAPKLAGISPYFLRNNPNDNQSAIDLANYLVKTYKNIAIITEKTDYPEGFKTVFAAAAAKDTSVTVHSEEYDTDTTDFRSLLTRVRSANPDAILINSQTSGNFLRIAQQARQLGITAQFATTVSTDPATVATSAYAENTIFVSAPGLSQGGKGAAFLAKYAAVYGAPPAYEFYSGAAYDDVYLIAQAIGNVGDDATKVDAYLHSLESYTGTIGTYHFGADGDFVGVSNILERLVNGKVVII